MKSKEQSKVAGTCSIPAYCIRTIGSRHILIGGGGGSAKTGVLNQIQLYLLNYGSKIIFRTNTYDSGDSLCAQLNSVIDTAEYANMNMDCIALNNEPERGQYLIAVGQDQFCTLYETAGFCLNQEEETISGLLAFDFRSLFRIETNRQNVGPDSYQKCVRLFRKSNQQNKIKMVTSGTDGFVRVWSITRLLEGYAKSRRRNVTNANIPETFEPVDSDFEIPMAERSIVDDIDVSPCGQILATTLSKQTILWNLDNNIDDENRQILVLPVETGAKEPLTSKFKVRILRFTNLDKTSRCAVFVTAHNQCVRTSKEISYLTLWSHMKGTNICRIVESRTAFKESISCLEISECGKFTAIGTLAGSVGIFDTQTLQSLLFIRNCHQQFVTALAFIPEKSYDIKDLGRIGEGNTSAVTNNHMPPGRCFVPGICAATSRAAIVSLSVDNRIMVHQLPFPDQSTFTGFLLQLSIFIAFVYTLFWGIFVYN